MGVTRCHFKSILPSAAAQRSTNLHGTVFAHQQLCQTARNREEGFSSLTAPSRWTTTWTCSLVTSTERFGADQMVTTPHAVVGPKEQYQVNELTFVG